MKRRNVPLKERWPKTSCHCQRTLITRSASTIACWLCKKASTTSSTAACECKYVRRTNVDRCYKIPFSSRPLGEVVAKKVKQQWDPDAQVISPISTPASGFSYKRKKCIIDDPLDFVDVDNLFIWNLNDLTRAGKLLRKPALPCHFDDEHEMRRVYSMIYDVYRCKLWQKLYQTLFGCDLHSDWIDHVMYSHEIPAMVEISEHWLWFSGAPFK